MINKLTIENFKSIKNLEIPCGKVNMFIGDTNSGKSNILEALSFFSAGCTDPSTFSEIFRFKTVSDLFFNSNINEKIFIGTQNRSFSLAFARNEQGAVLNYFEGVFDEFQKKPPDPTGRLATLRIEHNGGISFEGINPNTMFRTYVFKRNKAFKGSFRTFLDTPYGENIPMINSVMFPTIVKPQYPRSSCFVGK